MNFDTKLYWHFVKCYSNGRKSKRKARWLKKYLRLEKRRQKNFRPTLKGKN